jgi:transposase-like protein
MSKQINCQNCNKALGTIKTGSISKGLKPLCSGCFKRLSDAAGMWAAHNLKEASKQHSTDSNPFGDVFGDIFGKK